MRDYGSEISALAAQITAIMVEARKEIDVISNSQVRRLAVQKGLSMPDLCDNSMRPEYQKEGCE